MDPTWDIQHEGKTEMPWHGKSLGGRLVDDPMDDRQNVGDLPFLMLIDKTNLEIGRIDTTNDGLENVFPFTN